MKHSCSNAIFSIAVATFCSSLAFSCSSAENDTASAGRGGRTSHGGTAGGAGAGGSSAGAGGSASGAGGTQDGAAGAAGSAAAAGSGGALGSAGTAGSAGGGTGGTAGCTADQRDCGGRCVNVTTDSSNCGSCGKICMAGSACNASVCACMSPLSDCNGVCVDLASSSAHCGQCGRACVAPQVCSQRTCGTVCAGGLTECERSCVDLTTSSTHCGTCNTACASGRHCEASRCVCAAGQLDCTTSCVNSQTDNNNCGACGVRCPSGQSCNGGRCSCPTGQTDCGGVCVNLTSDAAHCSRCNNPCPSGTCSNSTCAPVTTGVIGWASVNGRGLATTTGGQGGTTVDVNSASALQSAASSSTRQIIRISGTLSVSELNVNSNKTLIGVGTTATIVGGININGKSNIILQNLRVNGKSSGAGGDAIHIENSHHVWIDHSDVWDAPDGNLDITNHSDLITVSWTRFWYSTSPGDNAHRFCVLIGSDDAADDAGYLNITFHHNWWAERVHERMPRVRYGKVHVFNNYYSSSGNSHCVRAGFESDVRVENNYFENVQNPYEIDSDSGTAIVSAAGNTFSGGGGSRDTRGTAFTPPYTVQMQAASAVRDAVRAGWGPR